jgi:DNA-binding NarL/FixJ family response regulator
VSSSVRVVIADDQQLVRTGLRMILDAQPDIDVVGEATNGREAVAMARELQPDVVLMDIRMPELDGIEATRRVVQRHGDTSTRVLMLTTFDLDEYVYDALRIAAELIIGETTVKTHVTRMMMKLGVHDRVQAVVLAYELGVVTPSRRPRGP